MQQRLLVIAIGICAVVLALLGAHRLWQRSGAPSTELDDALAVSSTGLAGLEMPSGLSDASPVSVMEGFLVATATESSGAPTEPRAPTTLEGAFGGTFVHDLCDGRESAWLALESLLATTDAPTITAAGARVADAATHGCTRPESERACTFARATIDGATATAPIGWRLLAHCPDEVALPLLDRVDAPAPAILDFVIARESLERRSVRLPAYVLQSVTSALGTNGPEREAFPFHELAAALGHYDDPSATRALVAMYEVAPDYARESIGIAIRFADDDRSRAIHQESCAGAPAGSVVHACDDGTLETQVGSFTFDPHLELARHPELRAELLAALERCARGGDPLSGMFCFRRLAELDRPRAASVAQSRITSGNVPLLGLPAVGDPPAYVSEAELDVRRFPTDGSLTAALASCGVRATPTRAWDRPVTVLDALAARDRALSLDPESGTFPTPHDALLRELARLVAPALDEVIFEQVAPDESHMAVGRYTLRAFVGGRVLETYARNYGDFYDVEAVVGFVNTLLVRRGALDRCRVSGETELTAIVCASLPQFAALEAAQLVSPAIAPSE